MSLRYNRLFALDEIDEYGWSVQLFNHLELGQSKAPSNDYNYWYVEFRFPFHSTWHSKEWGKRMGPWKFAENFETDCSRPCKCDEKDDPTC